MVYKSSNVILHFLCVFVCVVSDSDSDGSSVKDLRDGLCCGGLHDVTVTPTAGWAGWGTALTWRLLVEWGATSRPLAAR